MARFSRAARAGDAIRSRCDIHLHTKHHHCPHQTGGSCSGGSPNVFIEGRAAQRVGDNATYNSCQHGGVAKSIEGSGSVFINGKAAVRIKDNVQCQNPMCGRVGTVINGASTVFFGD